MVRIYEPYSLPLRNARSLTGNLLQATYTLAMFSYLEMGKSSFCSMSGLLQSTLSAIMRQLLISLLHSFGSKVGGLVA